MNEKADGSDIEFNPLLISPVVQLLGGSRADQISLWGRFKMPDNENNTGKCSLGTSQRNGPPTASISDKG